MGANENVYPAVAVTVDVAVFTIRDDTLSVLLIKRGQAPHKGRWALPGGFVQPEEGLDQAAVRELGEETGINAGFHLEQLRTYGAPRRDPRMRTVTVAYLALAPNLGAPQSGTVAAHAAWVPVADALGSSIRLAFDHAEILTDALERARAKLEYTPLATAFCSDEFTVAELRQVYETVWGTELDPRNFHRKVSKTLGLLEPTGGTTNRDGGRPAQLFRRGKLDLLNPPMTRP